MKKKYSLSQIIFLISFLFFQTLVIAQRDVYLVIGERNAQGRATIEAEDEVALTGVDLYNGTTWENAKNDSAEAPDGGLNRDSSVQKTASDQELNFAYAFGKMVNEVTGNQIGLVVNARSGADIEQWAKGGTGSGWYESTILQLNAALALGGSTLKGILWCHGEADRNDSGYITDLTTLISDFRTELGIADLPFIVCEISKQRTDNEPFNAAIKRIANSGDASYISNTAYVSSDGLQTPVGNQNDYNSNSQRVLGYRYAAKVLEMVYDYTYVENHIMYVTEDAYVRGGSNSGTAYEPGDDQRIRIKYTTSSPNNERMGLLKFDISTLTGTTDRIVVDATLKINAGTIDADMDISLYDMDTSWSESTVTLDYINANGGFATAITKSTTEFYRDTSDRDGDSDSTELIHNGADLTEFIKDEYDFGTSTIALGLKSDNDDGNDLEITPKDHSSDSALRPYIVVSYLVAPRPTTPTTKLAKLTFETDPTDTDPAITDISYTTTLTFDASSTPVPSGEFSDIGVGDAEDFFIRTKDGDQTGTDIDAVYSYIDPVDLGDYFFVASDIDDSVSSVPTYTTPVSLNLEEIDISNYENLEIRVYLASITGELNAALTDPAAWDNNSGSNNNDYVHFTYDVDNTGNYTNLLWVESPAVDGIINEEPRIDTNFDGTGNGTAIVSTFTQFIVPILTTGSTLDIQIEFKMDNHGEDLAIDNIEIWGTLINETCSGINVTWNGSVWSNGTGPDISTPVVINGPYTADITNGSFSACSLTVNDDLTIESGYYIEVEHDITVDASATFLVENNGALVQNVDSASFTNNGTTKMTKSTQALTNWYDYTYWSSPVSGLTIGTSPLAISDRCYENDAFTYLDVTKETNNNNATVTGSDDVDDDASDWVAVTSSTTLDPGVGYIASHTSTGFISGTSYDYDFEGEFNTGVITTPVYYNALNTGGHWNLIGNPYPCALDFDAFITTNPGVVEGVAYLWSHATNHSQTFNGNEDSNFSQDDYIIMNTGSGSVNNTAGTLLEYIPSGQSFFITSLSNDNVTFNNSMRIKNAESNSQFFKNTNKKATTEANKLWINLTSDIGIFNQVLIAYVDGATDNFDGMTYDATREASSATASIIYTLIEDKSDKKFAIQGKNTNSINEEEVIPLGFYASTDTDTPYNLSIDHLQGDFLTENTLYLKDNLLDVVHNLSTSKYVFTSNSGEFNDRFEILFNTSALSTNTIKTINNSLQIIYLDNHKINFKSANDLTTIKQVTIYDLLGRKLNDFEGESNSETYSLSYLSNATYIAKIKLSNGKIITKKIIKH
ncbi:MAG: sialate O-acetylesterase [Algibacter sp.]